MVKEISRHSHVSQIPFFEPTYKGRVSSLQDPSCLSSIKGNEEEILAKMWNYTKKGWNGIYFVFEKVLGWIFCQCFCKEEKMDLSSFESLGVFIAKLESKAYSIEERVSFYESLPQEVLTKVSESCNKDGKKGSKEIIENHSKEIIEAIGVYFLEISISMLQDLLNQAGSEKKNISLVKNAPDHVREILIDNKIEFSEEKFKKDLENLIENSKKALPSNKK